MWPMAYNKNRWSSNALCKDFFVFLINYLYIFFHSFEFSLALAIWQNDNVQMVLEGLGSLR